MTEIIVKKNKEEESILQNAISGESFEYFLQSQKATPTKEGLSDVGAYNLRASTADILNHCNPHDANNNREATHLVVGYVQSGKTMSFTGVLAMAHDNRYRVAIILTGITTNLLGQTADRLAKDLKTDGDKKHYSFLTNPSDDEKDSVIKTLRLSDRPLLVIPILKHKKYINDIAQIFQDEKVKRVMGNETVIIIDDEADQASLNGLAYKDYTEEEEKETATYAAIIGLREVLPGNSYIQYTATPQANILITTMDLLSPKTHTLLQPGEGYVGGRKFFGMYPGGQLYQGKLAVIIPEKEVYHKKQNPLREMPDSLREAIMMHVLAVVLVIKWYKRGGVNQLSMMIHPTDIIDGNKIFENWVKEELNLWSDCLDKPNWEQSHVQLMCDFESLLPKALEFYPEEGRPNFNDIRGYIPDIINDCKVYRITGESNDDPTEIKWNEHKMNVLVGGQMLNRGFTVEKLTTTYMPRYATGITNADTIEQRCRFFGYKMKYIESCRAYLPNQSIEDYKAYVSHEEELRSLLSRCSSLKEFEHSVMLSPRLRPTRQNVLPKKVVKSRLSGWSKFERISGQKMINENRELINTFVDNHLNSSHEFNFANYNSQSYKNGEIKKHSLKDMNVDDIISLMSDFTAGNYTSTVTKSMIMRYLAYLSEQGNKTIKVIFMSKGEIRERRKIKVNDDLWRVELFQGRSNINEPDNYIGDTNLYDQNHITLQIHHIRIKDMPVANVGDNETYAIAIHIPDKLATQYYTTI